MITPMIVVEATYHILYIFKLKVFVFTEVHLNIKPSYVFIYTYLNVDKYQKLLCFICAEGIVCTYVYLIVENINIE
jgi:hypothetical protein